MENVGVMKENTAAVPDLSLKEQKSGLSDRFIRALPPTQPHSVRKCFELAAKSREPFHQQSELLARDPDERLERSSWQFQLLRSPETPEAQHDVNAIFRRSCSKFLFRFHPGTRARRSRDHRIFSINVHIEQIAGSVGKLDYSC